MKTFSDKLQGIYNQLLLLLDQLSDICVIKLSNLPNQIGRMVVGENKLPSCINKTIIEITKDDLIGAVEIRPYAFYNCHNLTNVEIPDSVTTIGKCAFYNCYNLTNIRLFSISPPTYFGGLGASTDMGSSTSIIHVPIGSGNAYKSATNWSKYADRIVEDIIVE